MRAHSAPSRLRPRNDVAFAVAVLLAVAVIAWIVITIQQLSHDLRNANQARDALAQQVQQLGASPVAGEPGSRGEPGKSITGPSGPPGPPGRDAPTITPSPGPRGPSGKPGADSTVPGPSGSPGQPGADSNVPGPSGPLGADGQDGKDGADGKDGRDGQTCPDGYSLQAPSWDPDALVCRKDGAPDPTPKGPLGLSALTLPGMFYRKDPPGGRHRATT